MKPMKRRATMNRWSIVMGVTLHAVIASACASKVNHGGGSETGFLGCAADSECGKGQTCVESKCVDQSGRTSEAGAEAKADTGGPTLGCVDVSGLQTEPPVSFEQDIMP